MWWSFLPLVENEIRRGAFYMRPRKFILPQAGTGGVTAGGGYDFRWSVYQR